VSASAGSGPASVRVTVRCDPHRIADSAPLLPIPPFTADGQALEALLAGTCLVLPAQPAAVSWARNHVRQVLWNSGLKELIEPAELVVSDVVTNAIRAGSGLCAHGSRADEETVRLWLAATETGLLVLVWDASPSKPEPQDPGLDADGGRGLLLVDALTAAWGSFDLADEPGKVLWALCQG
jgi:anti-sigma regulatory factor (Ser/Thr protein kinase)